MAAPKKTPLSDEAYAALIKEVKRPKSEDERLFIQIGWKILQAKFQYYIMDDPLLTDQEYDMLEREYDRLAKALGVPPTASDMVGFNQTRPSCALVADRTTGVRAPSKPEK